MEDDIAARILLRRTLEEAGWTIREAEDGVDGLDRLAEAVPDLILLDPDMPRMNGFQVLEVVHGHPQWRDLPIMLATARDLSGEDQARLNGGPSRVLRDEPIGCDRSVATINEWFRRGRLGRAGQSEGESESRDHRLGKTKRDIAG